MGAIDAVLRLQNFYKINSKDIAKGNIEFISKVRFSNISNLATTHNNNLASKLLP